MKIQILIVWLCLSSQITAQITLQGKIIDVDTKEPIPYVNLGIIKLGEGTVSDDLGKYKLAINSIDNQVTISSIGYETLQIEALQLQNNSTIELKRVDYELEIVEVEATRLIGQDILLGAKNKNRGLSIGFGSAQLGTQIGAVIKIEAPSYIKSANFVLNHAKGDSLLFRINIYQFKDGVIGENLVTQNILIKEKQRKGVISIDMEPYNLILDSDVLLALEWIRDFDELGNKAITFDTKKGRKEAGVYVKYSSVRSFELMPHQMKLKPCFYFIAKQVTSKE